MSRPLDVVLERLANYRLRENAPGRWRAVCPCCGEHNPNTLSVGEGDSGAVLLRCFKSECSAESIAQALGLEITDLFPPRESHAGPAKRRRMLPAHQALGLLADEANLIAVCAANLFNGVELAEQDLDRVLTAAARIQILREESMA